MTEKILEKYKGEKVLVTGGAGFVGSNLVKYLLELGAVVDIIDDLFTGDLKNLEGLKGYNFIEGDVRYILELTDIGKYSYIFHLAARNIIVSTKDPKEDYSVNIGGTLTMLDLLRNYESLYGKKSNLKKFVYTGSVSIYGNPRRLPINEDDGINVLSPYAVSKLGGENYTKIYYENYNVPTTVVRYSNVFGDNQSTSNPYCGVIGKIIESISNNKKPIVHGDGEQTRDFTYVEDAVTATLYAGLLEKSIGEAYNIGTGIETSINKLIEIINKIYNKNIEAEYVDKRDIDNIRRRVVNIEKIRSKLRWTPHYTLEKGLKQTIEWYERNR
jgi:UDP-glucose 4-epimerase